MNRIIAISVVEGHVLYIQFSDGESKYIDFRPLIGQGISAPLLDEEYFHLVSIDNGGGIEWPNGMDFCPNFLKEYAENKESVA